MANETFGQLWRAIRLYCPFIPPGLAQAFVRDRYRTIVERAQWAGTMAEGLFNIPAAYSTGTVTTSNGSATVTGAATAWTAAHVQQQFYQSRAPFYTVLAVDVGAQTLTLDKQFAGTGGAGQTYTISQVYVTAPTDLLSLVSVKDVENNWRLRLRVSQQQLDRWDAARTYSSLPWVVADLDFSSAGVPRYELWPRLATAKQYPFLYRKRPADLAADADLPIWPIRSDAVKYGALAELARWPGTTEQRNPMFDMKVAAGFEARFERELVSLLRQDQEVYVSDSFNMADTWASTPAAPIDAAFLQSHDFGGGVW